MRGVTWLRCVWLALATAASATVAYDPTTLSTIFANPATGIFNLCYWPTCSTSLSLSLYQVSVDTVMDTTNTNIISSRVLADFTALDTTDDNNDGIADPVVVRTDESSTADWPSDTLYARACIATACSPRPSNESEFQYLSTSTVAEDAIGFKMEVQRFDRWSQMDSPYETYSVARGAMRLNLRVALSPLVDQPLPMFAISFLVAALEDHLPTTSISRTDTVDGHMYLQRIHFNQDMFLDLPTYTKINNVDTRLHTVVKAHESGELKDLVEITLVFGPVQKSIEYIAAASSMSLVNNITSTARPSTPTGLVNTSGTTLPTNFRTSARGMFALCLNATCGSSDAIVMGFSGLQVKGPTTTLPINRFAFAPAFDFIVPSTFLTELMVSTFFETSVPQSVYRPPRRLTSGGSDPIFAGDLTYFVVSASSKFGDKMVDEPRGTLQFTASIRNWLFSSPSETLELSMAISLDGGTAIGDDYISSLHDDYFVLIIQGDKILRFPTFAIAENNIVVPVGVALSRQDEAGDTLTVTFTFSSFASRLDYTAQLRPPGLSLTTPTPTPTPTPSREPEPDTAAPTPVALLDEPKRKVESWTTAGVLLGFLAFIVVVSILQCVKKTRVKIDFSKIIP